MSRSSEISPEERGRGDGDKGIEEDHEEDHEEEHEGEEDKYVLPPEKLAEMCAKCGGLCCKYYTVMLDEPEDADDFDEMRWFLAHEGCYIYVDEGEWHLNVISRCRFLDEQGRCTMYDRRPGVCREFGHDEECEFTGEFDFEHVFETIDDLEAYARGVLTPEEFGKLSRFSGGHGGPA